MNYLKELKLFYQRVDTEPIPSNAILLWYTLMSIANNIGWKEEFSVPLSLLESKTKLHKTTICRMRDILAARQLISYRSAGGKVCAMYRMCSLEFQLPSNTEMQDGLALHSETQTDLELQLVSHDATQNNLELQLESHGATQNNLELQLALHDATQETPKEDLELHDATVTATIPKLKLISISNKENIKRNFEEKAEDTMMTNNSPNSSYLFPKEKEKSCAKKEKERATKKAPSKFSPQEWLDKLELPWQDLMIAWLAYKRERNEFYKGKMSHDQCLHNLKRLSGNDGRKAQEIINQSIANGWAGLFELREQYNYPQKQYSSGNGLPIGHVLQPRSEERRRELLEKFGK